MKSTAVASLEELVGMYALAAYLYNTSPHQFGLDRCMRDGEPHPNYVEEKAEEFHRSPARALAGLDDIHFANLMGLALERHREFAEKAAYVAWTRLRLDRLKAGESLTPPAGG